ncbi:acyl-CoA dehydrogenase family protein [Lactiplantibacillus sp. WILCCON 0030]|uniref:Acyl-CoA dehydrogenase family protein n=1 Tax=Lactiplantibacillus brownii TaxID=3069269 RepID=A0ABU1A5B5_9LACO|nr:acyl-CoA dehydrogenase family protein [Lactiplantibacillus brownii]MDQ7936169.1 acyl-CoA dehydrogenase family protein [Lactiplantibacillus brownii]
MDLNLTAEQQALWQHLTNFSQEKLAPLDAQLAQGRQASAEAYQLLVTEGLPELGLAQPFGLELDLSTQALAVAAVAQGSVSAAVMLATTWVTATALTLYGKPAQFAETLQAAKTKPLAIAVTEPDGGGRQASQTSASKQADEHWSLVGDKSFVVNGGQAAAYLVLTRTFRGNHLQFLVPATQKALRVLEPVQLAGLPGVPAATIRLNGVSATTSQILGYQDQGMTIARHIDALARIFIGAISVGVGQRTLAVVKRYAHERALGKGLLSDEPLIQQQAGELAIRLHTSELLTWDAAQRVDQKQDFEVAATMAAVTAAENSLVMTQQAAQLIGGIAYTKALPLAQLTGEAQALGMMTGAKAQLTRQVGWHALGIDERKQLTADQPVAVAKRLKVADLHRVVKTLRLTEDVPVTVGSIKAAKRLIVLGQGALEPAVLLQAQQLAKWIGAAVAVTQPLTKLEQFSQNQLIGIDGATVAPEVIINIGISGAEQYVLGMTGAKHILSVNPDEKAPIFKVSQQAFVGTAADFLTGMIAALN